jgi:hypothetical protein
MSRLAIRWRLTLWYSAILAATIALGSVGISFLMRQQLMSRTDANLKEELQGIDKELEESSTLAGFTGRLHRRLGHYERMLFDERMLRSDAPSDLRSHAVCHSYRLRQVEQRDVVDTTSTSFTLGKISRILLRVFILCLGSRD